MGALGSLRGYKDTFAPMILLFNILLDFCYANRLFFNKLWF